MFGEKNAVVVDPAEEKLKSEFSHVTRAYIPMHSVVRIDLMDKRGVAKITECNEQGKNVMAFPMYTKGSE